MTTDFRSCPACHSDLSHCGTMNEGKRCAECGHTLVVEVGSVMCKCGICGIQRRDSKPKFGTSLGGVGPISPAR